jgi:bacterioferritin
MNGNPEVIDRLNFLLKSELAAINQYVVHAQMDEIYGYDKLSEYVMKRAKDEMKHAEMLIERMLFLRGMPIVSILDPIFVGQDVETQLNNDHSSEETAIKNYNEAIRLCTNLEDVGTEEILEDILEDEERHIREIEEKQYHIAQMGIANFLSLQA